jgi:hypothetical protein
MIPALMISLHYPPWQKHPAQTSHTGSPPLVLEGHRYLPNPSLSWRPIPRCPRRALVPRWYRLSIMTVDHCVNCAFIRADRGSIVDKYGFFEVLHYPRGRLPWSEFQMKILQVYRHPKGCQPLSLRFSFKLVHHNVLSRGSVMPIIHYIPRW